MKIKGSKDTYLVQRPSSIFGSPEKPRIGKGDEVLNPSHTVNIANQVSEATKVERSEAVVYGYLNPKDPRKPKPKAP